MEKLKERILSEQQAATRMTNNGLVCRDCKYKFDDTVRLGNTATCAAYDVKPNKVLMGNECAEYERKV